MKPFRKILTAFAFSAITSLVAVSGCSEAATRTLNIFQFLSTNTYDGPFRIDTSGLPPDAIESQTETGGNGKPDTRLKLNMKYEFEIVVRLVDKGDNGYSTPDTTTATAKDGQ